MGFSLSDFAPTLMKIVETAVPGGDLAMMGARALAKAFGKTLPELDVDDIKSRIADPEIQLKLKEAERLLQQDLLVHAREMRALGVQEYQTQVSDLASVRQMITATHDRTSAHIAYACLALLAGVLGMIAFGRMPTDQGSQFLLGGIVTALFQGLSVFTGAMPPSMNPLAKK